MSASGIPRQEFNANKGPSIIILVSVLTFFSVTTTALRLAVRGLNRHLSWDDYLIASAAVLAVIECSFNILQVQSGFGHHVEYLVATKADIVAAVKWTWLAELFLFFVLPLTKISICFFIFRIKNGGWLKWFLYCLITGLIATNALCVVILLAQCTPVQANFDPSRGKCWSVKVFNSANWLQVAYGIMSDFIFSFIPIVILWNVKIPVRLKIAICGLMSIGLIATACAAVRAYVSAANNGAADLTWDLAVVVEWAILEEHFAILGANLALSHYIVKFFRKGRRGSGLIDAPSHMSSFNRNRTTTANKSVTHRASYGSNIPLTTTVQKAEGSSSVGEPLSLTSQNQRSRSSDLECGDSREFVRQSRSNPIL